MPNPTLSLYHLSPNIPIPSQRHHHSTLIISLQVPSDAAVQLVPYPAGQLLRGPPLGAPGTAGCGGDGGPADRGHATGQSSEVRQHHRLPQFRQQRDGAGGGDIPSSQAMKGK